MKYTIEETSKLLANKTHAIYSDNKDFELLRDTLRLAFPEDVYTDINDFADNLTTLYGYDDTNTKLWCVESNHLTNLIRINLSEIELGIRNY